MKYLKKVILENFQSHKYSVVEFDKGLNIIVGPSDTGKSAIIRGIKWVLYNEPSGDYFIREGETEASVMLEFSNNIKVKRFRSKSKNSYILYNREGEEIVYEGFGNKVPQEIIDLLSIKKIPLDSNETNSINIGEQLEGAFLLSEKGSTRASAIGRLVGVNLIDDALKESLRDIRNLSIQKKTIENNIDKTKIELEDYSYLNKLQENIIELEKLKELISKKVHLKELLSKNLNDYNYIIKEINYLNETINNLDKIEVLEKNILYIENKFKKLSLYKRINKNLYQTKDQITYNEILLNGLNNIQNVDKILDKIISLKDRLNLLNKFKKEIKKQKLEKLSIIEINDKLKGLKSVVNNTTIIEEKIDRLKNLLLLKKEMDSINKSIYIGEDYLSKLYNLDEIGLIFDNLYNCINKLSLLSQISIKLKEFNKDMRMQNKALIIAKNDIESNLEKYEEILIENKICPFCLSVINKDKIEHITEHYS